LVGKFLHAPAQAIVFTRGTTDSLNFLAYALESKLQAGDAILLSLLEHHSNIVPWQLLAKRRGINLSFAEVDDSGALQIDDFTEKLRRLKPKIVSVTHIANSLGTVVPVEEICALAHKYGSLVILDVAQSVAHTPLDVSRMGCDFLAFSGHKLYGPTGIGVLYGKPELLAEMEPVQGGGGMIASVSTETATWADPPQRFEAGTPAIAEAIGLAAALDFISTVGLERIEAYEQGLFAEAFERLAKEEGVRLYGPYTRGKAQRSIISFTLKGLHPHDFATIADTFNVQLRAGHHCAMPLLKRLGLQATARVSLGMYNSMDDIERLCEGIDFARRKFG
jgi:cysteine desulfurase / selenocysteine lyase